MIWRNFSVIKSHPLQFFDVCAANLPKIAHDAVASPWAHFNDGLLMVTVFAGAKKPAESN